MAVSPCVMGACDHGPENSTHDSGCKRDARQPARVTAVDSVQAALAKQGMVAVGSTPDAMGKAIADEFRKWGEVVAHRKLPVH